jgi:uncharacterized membrane protein HdeD (DUF308 family)
MATRIESTTDTAVDTAMLSRNWWAVAIRGVAAIIFGVLAFVLPGITLAAMVLLFGAYALVDGIFALIAAVRGRDETQPWWELVIEGVLSIAAGIVTFTWPGLTTLVLFYVIGSWAIITGVLEIVAAVRLRKEIRGEVWLALSGVLSIAFGVLVYLFPVAGGLALVLWTGAYAIVFGALLVGLSVRLRNAQRNRQRAPLARAA